MADYTKTITNSLNLFGNNPSSKWGQANFPYTMTWGTTKWGEGTATIIFSVEKLIENSLVPSNSVSNDFIKVISDSITPAFETSSEYLENGVWRIVFISDTTEAENRDFATWVSGTTQAATYTSIAAASTTWT